LQLSRPRPKDMRPRPRL